MHYIQAKGILSPHNGMNLYRGCTHGCIYCDSRSACYQMDHAFTDVAVKENALSLLESALRRKRKPCMLGLGSMSDPYQPLEAELRYTRQALALAARYGYGFTLITKSAMVLEDMELLQTINHRSKCVVQMTLTTYDEALCRQLEPNVSTSAQRVAALCALARAGIPTVVWLCPLLPYLNDTRENLAGLLAYCREAQVYGVLCFGMGLTLREGNREYFYQQLDQRFPGLKARYQKEFGNRYQVASPQSAALLAYFHQTCESYGIIHDNRQIFTYLSAYEDKSQGRQLSFFD